MSFLNPSSPQVASSSRGKMALKPGHSLMDWVRFKTNIPSKAPQQISSSELAKHNKISDAWTSINGAVYDITAYIDYHPGGIEELMKGAGIDSTELFNRIHKWVNFQNMLKEFLVGYLVPDSFNQMKESFPLDFKSPHEVQPLRKINAAPINSFRYDCYQSERCYTLIVYSKISTLNKVRKSYHYGCVKGKTIEFCISCIDQQFVLHIEMDCEFKNWEVRNSNLKFEVVIHKKEEVLWNDEGRHLLGSKKTLSNQFQLINFTLICIGNEYKSHDTRLLTLSGGNHVYHFHPTLGSHIYVIIPQSGQVICDRKPYTVFNIIDNNTFQLLVKQYPDGVFSNFLGKLKIGQQVEVEGFDQCFDMNLLYMNKSVVILAAGTGITPFYRILVEMAQDDIYVDHTCNLLFYNKTQKDILIREELEQLKNKTFKLNISHILSQEICAGPNGHVSQEHVQNFPNDSLFLVCGPLGFMECVRDILYMNKVNKSKIVEFKS